MSTPQSTPLKQVKLGIVSAKSMPLTNEYKRLLSDQHQRLSLKHQQDLDLIDDIRSYIKARLSIEKDYTNALQKLTKQHSNYINKKFALLAQLDQQQQQQQSSPDCRQDQQQSSLQGCNESTNKLLAGSAGSNSDPSSSAGDRNVNRNQTSVNNNNTNTNNNNNNNNSSNNNNNNSNKPSSLYKVWSEHINYLQLAAKNRWDQFEQLNLIVDKLKDIRQHKASIGKKCLDTHLKPIQEDLLLSLIDVERAKKLYYEDESQARKARENEERIKKKRSGLLTKFTDLQAKKEKSSAQREANDIQSTQARNDYIMALAAANAYLKYYYQRDLNDFIHLIDDGVLDHCKIFMATLSECEINWLKYSLSHAQNWSKLINLTGSQQTNYIFLECEQSKCLRTKQELAFEPCNSDPIQKISLEHNADYALQHEIDKWFTWFKKECRNLSQLMHQLDTYQSAFVEGKKSIEVNGQTIDDLEPKIVNLKQQIRKCEAAKLRAQARLKAIKEGGMQIEEWSEVELEIRADMARAQEEQQRAQRLKETRDDKSMDEFVQGGGRGGRTGNDYCDEPSSSANDGLPEQGRTMVQLQVSRDSDDSDVHAGGDSIHNLASVSRSNSNLVQKQQNAITGYSALTDPSLVWQDNHSSSAWGGATSGSQAQPGSIVVSHSFNDQLQQQQQQQQQQPSTAFIKSPTSSSRQAFNDSTKNAFDPLGANQQQQSNDKQQQQQQQQQQQIPTASMSIQSSSPLSAIMNGGQHLSQSPYQGIMSEAYKSDYECDYTRTGQHATIRSAASSAEPAMYQLKRNNEQAIEFGSPGDIQERMDENNFEQAQQNHGQHEGEFDYGAGAGDDDETNNVSNLLNKRVIALYNFDKNNEDDLAFNEGDLLLVIETNPDDTNWIKAQSMSSGESGFIPSSYVRLFDDNDAGDDGDGDRSQRRLQDDTRNTHQSSGWPVAAVSCDERAAGKQEQEQEQEHGPPPSAQENNETHSYTICRALYDYTPEANAFEDDGLPHLSLRQGELMHIIDQGDDDGWWLVEKQDERGTRGHVPSMLVEEMDSNEDELESNEDDDDDEFDDDDGELSDDMHEGSGPIKGPPPSFEPPVLEHDQNASKPTVVENFTSVESKFNENFDASGGTLAEPANGGAGLIINKADEQQQQQNEGKEASKSTTDNSSLIPTSFIIIEPTPEVESRRFEDNLNEHEGDSAHQSGVNSGKIIDATEGSSSSDINPVKRDAVENQEADNQPAAPPPLPSIEQQQQQQQQTHRDQSTRQVVHSRQPPSQISYSIVNEDFVLEKPTRRPYQQSASNSLDNATGHHHEPTIVEEEDSCQNEIISSSRNSVPPSCDGASASGNGDDDDGAESDYRINMPAPPEVVIDSVEAIPRSPDLSFDNDDANKDDNGDTHDPDGDSQKSETSTSTSERKPIKHTGYANVSPILRHHAEEFCKQLIEEAIMLAPGSQIGPSTSSANVSLDGSPNNGANEADHDNDNDNDFEHGGSFEDSN